MEDVKGLTFKKREAASYLLIFMISDEQRNSKPYAIPVRVIKYKSITDSRLRVLTDELKTDMKRVGMKTVGMFFLQKIALSRYKYLLHKHQHYILIIYISTYY